jgi:NAD+ kinase
VLGGDGTILSALDYALPNDIPMLGINLGRMGFLTEVDPKDLRRDVISVLEGRYSIDPRTVMTIKGQDEREFFALNEIVVRRSTPAVCVLSLEIEVNGIMVDRISGDGLIVATPTGSTGYSMSAGGPLVTPGVDLILLTPVCAHTPHAKPIIVPAGAKVEVELEDQCEGILAMDGRRLDTLPAGGKVCIRRNDRPARFIRMNEPDFFGRLKSKLLDWGR